MAMQEELDEFEVLWPDSDADEPSRMSSPVPVLPTEPTPPTPRLRQRRPTGSLPVDVPCKAARFPRWRDGGQEDDGHGSVGLKVAIMPPHLLVIGRQRPDEEETTATALALASMLPLGPRPCKRARDLHHLRNSVLRMTGFIEG
ncbi:hypothetical protein ABZP36_013100 [Zizania latifolia]